MTLNNAPSILDIATNSNTGITFKHVLLHDVSPSTHQRKFAGNNDNNDQKIRLLYTNGNDKKERKLTCIYLYLYLN